MLLVDLSHHLDKFIDTLGHVKIRAVNSGIESRLLARLYNPITPHGFVVNFSNQILKKIDRQIDR